MPPGPLASKHPFLLVRPPKLAITAEEDVDASSIAMDDDADEWRVVWLIRKGDGKWSGGGFSGGWRGCAIDLKLAVGDAIVFEVLPGRRDGLLALQMRVFRARDPATIRPTWEALEEMMNDDQDANNAAEERREKVSTAKNSPPRSAMPYCKASWLMRMFRWPAPQSVRLSRSIFCGLRIWPWNAPLQG